MGNLAGLLYSGRGSLKPLLFCTEVSKLHRSLKFSEPQRKEGRVKEINQKFLWDAQMPTWNRLLALIPSTLTTGRTFQNKSREEVCSCYEQHTFGLEVTCARMEHGRKQVNKKPEEHCLGSPPKQVKKPFLSGVGYQRGQGDSLLAILP